jgi:predicted 3-demethylubiquinone-9 3-methyltransferase (glyoxalase superfamily)
MTTDGFTTCLWFDGQAEEAAEFYVSVFEKNSAVGNIGRYTEAGPGPAGSVMAVEFTANGQKFVGLNGGPEFTFSEAISFQIYCDDQAEVDHYWSRLGEGARTLGPCGWLKDKYGLSWQVIPKEMMAMVSDPDTTKATRATKAMLATEGKLDLATIRRAYEGAYEGA